MTDPAPEPIDEAQEQRQKNLNALRLNWRERDAFCGDGYDVSSHRTWNNHGFQHMSEPLGPVARADIEDAEDAELETE